MAENLRKRRRAEAVEARGCKRFGLVAVTGRTGKLLDHVPEIVLADVVHLWLRIGERIEGGFLNVGFGNVM